MPGSKQKLPQLYRFCFLMTGDPAKAKDVFEATIREAALRLARGQQRAKEKLWLFEEARWRCVAATAGDPQAEAGKLDESDLSPDAKSQIEQLEPSQLAAWIAGAPEPQRSALALFYLDEFSYPELLSLLDLKLRELGELIERGRRQFQAWLHAMTRPTET